MKYSHLIPLCFLLSACTTNYHYQSEHNPKKWQGQNISAVEKQWGSADQIFHTRTGVSYYVYTTTSGKNYFNSISTNFGLSQINPSFPLSGQTGLKCSAIFQTDKNGVIIGTSHSGSNCGGEWAPN